MDVKLIGSPMEAEFDVSVDYFDCVYSIYAVRWMMDFDATFCRLASYLKTGGEFIFSWTHPIYFCMEIVNGDVSFDMSYFDDDKITKAQIIPTTFFIKARKLRRGDR